MSHEKRTRNNSLSLNLPSVRTKFSKSRSINTLFDWWRRHWIIAYPILRNIDLKVLRRSEILLNFSKEILYKSFFRWFGNLSLFSPFYAYLCSYRSIFVWLLLLLKLFLKQQTLVWHTSVGIFLLWHISSVYFCCHALLILVTCQLLCGLVFQH